MSQSTMRLYRSMAFRRSAITSSRITLSSLHTSRARFAMGESDLGELRSTLPSNPSLLRPSKFSIFPFHLSPSHPPISQTPSNTQRISPPNTNTNRHHPKRRRSPRPLRSNRRSQERQLVETEGGKRRMETRVGVGQRAERQA